MEGGVEEDEKGAVVNTAGALHSLLVFLIDNADVCEVIHGQNASSLQHSTVTRRRATLT